MSKAALVNQYQRAFSLWPADALRPDISFSKIIHKNVEQRFANEAVPIDFAKEASQINALLSLLENRYTRRYPLSKHMLEPKSNPNYYKNLVKEIEEAPTRSWFGNQLNKWKGFIRFN